GVAGTEGRPGDAVSPTGGHVCPGLVGATSEVVRRRRNYPGMVLQTTGDRRGRAASDTARLGWIHGVTWVSWHADPLFHWTDSGCTCSDRGSALAREGHSRPRSLPRGGWAVGARLRAKDIRDRGRSHEEDGLWERACARRAFATKVAPTRRMPVEARPQTVAILEAAVPAHLPQAEPCRGREGLAAKSRRRL